MMWETYFLFYYIIFNDIVATASDQDGVADVIISTDLQMKGELCLEPSVH